VLAWLSIQGAYTYLGMVWHGLAAESLGPGALEEHGRQFAGLRRLQIATGLAVGACVLAWWLRAGNHRSDPARVVPGRGWLARAVAALAAAAALAHGLAAGLAADPLRPLDLGAPLPLLILAALLEIAAATLGIVLVRRVTAGPAGPSTSP
jgi:hypothetical protein